MTKTAPCTLHNSVARKNRLMQCEVNLVGKKTIYGGKDLWNNKF